MRMGMAHSKKDDEAKAERGVASRAAYSDAAAMLREKHRQEFDDLLDAAYEARGLASPRRKRAERFAAAEDARAQREQAKQAKRAEKIAAMEQELADLKATQLPLDAA
jgi:hypothetical protein